MTQMDKPICNLENLRWFFVSQWERLKFKMQCMGILKNKYSNRPPANYKLSAYIVEDGKYIHTGDYADDANDQ